MEHKKESITVHSEGQLVVKSKNKAGEDPNSSQRERERENDGDRLSCRLRQKQTSRPNHTTEDRFIALNVMPLFIFMKNFKVNGDDRMRDDKKMLVI